MTRRAVPTRVADCAAPALIGLATALNFLHEYGYGYLQPEALLLYGVLAGSSTCCWTSTSGSRGSRSS